MMRHFTYILAVFLAMSSCSSSDNGEKHELGYKVLEGIEQLPDTILASPLNHERQFQLNLSKENIDFDATSKLRGDWQAIQGEIHFLLTRLEISDKVIFKDTIDKAMTGWGMLVYNKSAKFYFGEDGSYMYDYFVDQGGFLNIMQLEYRNDDLSFKEEPEAIVEKIGLGWLRDNEIELISKNRRLILKKLPLKQM